MKAFITVVVLCLSGLIFTQADHHQREVPEVPPYPSLDAFRELAAEVEQLKTRLENVEKCKPPEIHVHYGSSSAGGPRPYSGETARVNYPDHMDNNARGVHTHGHDGHTHVHEGAGQGNWSPTHQHSDHIHTHDGHQHYHYSKTGTTSDHADTQPGVHTHGRHMHFHDHVTPPTKSPARPTRPEPAPEPTAGARRRRSLREAILEH